MIDERQHAQYTSSWNSCIDDNTGIVIPSETGLSEWERQSLPLVVSSPYHWIFEKFDAYFESEMNAINDATLGQEMQILDLLSKY